ncbi:hypothetical protein [Nonomuraea guangzhouensis]|uniref:Uncharacterized protein n=1 Tax=Nonomuraea guangzhouensis TaxID=1291555 RepID=A0ABW4GZP6_9ACTN|nr:hypothetical protein [Nonomuraea guangzhouensis]
MKPKVGDEIQNFDERFSEAFFRRGWRTSMLPAEAVARWHSFAEDCIWGYPWDVEDYFNDLSLRSLLGTTLPELDPVDHGRASGLRKSIAMSDEVLKRVLVRDSFPDFSEAEWWMRCTPIYAAKKFCAEFYASYGVEIASRSRYDDEVDEMARMIAEGLSVAGVCVIARNDHWYVSLRPGLFIRACRDAFLLSRESVKVVWKWLMREMSDDELHRSLTLHL